MADRRNKKPNRRYKNRLSPLERLMRALRFSFFMGSAAVGVLVMSAAFIFSYDLTTQSEVFRAQKITVAGIQRLTRSAILEKAELKAGMNIFSVNLPLIRKRLLDHPWIAKAEISRIPPDRLTIAIKEHVPVALIRLDHTYILNTEGEIFKPWISSDPRRFPIIEGIEFEDLHIRGEIMSAPLKAVMEIIFKLLN